MTSNINFMAPRKKAVTSAYPSRVTRSRKKTSTGDEHSKSSFDQKSQSVAPDSGDQLASSPNVPKPHLAQGPSLGVRGNDDEHVDTTRTLTWPTESTEVPHPHSSPQRPADPATDPFGFFAAERILKYRRHALKTYHDEENDVQTHVEETPHQDEQSSGNGPQELFATPQKKTIHPTSSTSGSASSRTPLRSPLQDKTTRHNNTQPKNTKRRKKITTLELEELLPRRKPKRNAKSKVQHDSGKTKLGKQKDSKPGARHEESARLGKKPTAEEKMENELIDLHSKSTSERLAQYKDLDNYKLETETVIWL